jgi:hypothetical protein
MSACRQIMLRAQTLHTAAQHMQLPCPQREPGARRAACVRAEEVTLYVKDHGDEPIATADGSAKVIIRSGRRNPAR